MRETGEALFETEKKSTRPVPPPKRNSDPPEAMAVRLLHFGLTRLFHRTNRVHSCQI